MASITVSNLNVAGLDLFNDQESYLSEVTDDELGLTHGGISPTFIAFGKGVLVATRASSGYCVRGLSMASGVSAYFIFR
uniref:Uncharacterized protein n=1 Tax=Nostoc sp. PCC 9205 TaxID=2099383 RepID=A0A2P0ZGL5_9NOSO|nr:hypothetical protein [Nostoc sp. PCC 9205]